MFRGSVKSTGHPLNSPVSPSLPLPRVTVCHHVSSSVYVTLHNPSHWSGKSVPWITDAVDMKQSAWRSLCLLLMFPVPLFFFISNFFFHPFVFFYILCFIRYIFFRLYPFLCLFSSYCFFFGCCFVSLFFLYFLCFCLSLVYCFVLSFISWLPGFSLTF